MGSTLVMKVKSIVHFLDVDSFLVGVVLQNELLEEKEGTLVVNALAELDLGNPLMRSPLSLAVVTL